MTEFAHEDCVRDETARSVASASVRAWRIMLARLSNDEDSVARVFAEVEKCPECLFVIAQLFLGAAVGRRGKEPNAIQIAETLLANAIAKRDAL